MPKKWTHKEWAHRGAMAVGALVAITILLVLAVATMRARHAEEATRVRTPIPSSGPGFGLALYQALGETMRAGHEVKLVNNGAIFDELDAAIRAATSSVHVDVFIWQKGKASDRMLTAIEQRKPGVACRVIVDDLGSPHFDDDIRPRLEHAGCEARIFRRAPGQRDELARSHRKIVVVDGRIAFTGGFGIRDEWLGDGATNDAWRDTAVRFSGPSVTDAQQAISEHWHEAGGRLFPAEAFPGFQPTAPPPTTGTLAVFVGSVASRFASRAERLLELLIAAASKRLWIANAYFVPPKAVLDRLKEEAHEGVDVRLLMPGKKSDSNISLSSQHIEYSSLIADKIRVFEYQPSMMHGKTLVVDDDLSLVGSINFDVLSLDELEEDALVVQDRAFNEEMAKSFEADCARSTQVH
jgi:cardiolipin synthase